MKAKQLFFNSWGVVAMEKEVSLRVKYQETDRMGVVYYANYFIWFEVGRNEYLRDLGYSYLELEKEGLRLPVVKSYCEYKRPAYYDDLIILKTSIKDLTPVRISFCYNVYRKTGTDDKFLAFGETTHAFVNFVNNEGKPVNLKKNYENLFNVLNSKISCKDSWYENR